MKNILTILGRKFLMAETAIITAFVFLYIGKLDQSGFVTLVLGIGGLYFGANVVQGKGSTKKDGEGV